MNTLKHITTSKNKYPKLLSIFLFFLCFYGTAQVITKTDTTSIKIGEELRIQFEIEADSTDLVVFPDLQTFLPLEVIESYATDTSYVNSKIKYRKQYGLTQFDSGTYTIPRQKIIFNNKFFLSDSIKVEVRDVAVDTTKQKMFDIKPVVAVGKPPSEIVTYIIWLVPFILLGLAIWYFVRQKKKKAEAQKQLPPYEEALVALQELDNSAYLIENKSKKYYSLLTEIVKRYLDREVDNAALESTTDELIERLQELKKSGNFDFETGDIKKLEAILKRADLVKFAKMQQASGQAEADRMIIGEIINHTHEAVPEPTQEELLEDETYRLAQEKRKRKNKIKKIIAGIVSVIFIALVTTIAIYGWDKVQHKITSVFGVNTMKNMVEGRWYKSEYGAPSIIIETPKVLARKEVTNQPKETTSTHRSYFESGIIGDNMFVSIAITKLNKEGAQGQDQESKLDLFIEEALVNMETNGALNMVVKKESFSSEEGIEGLKAIGDFNLKSKGGKISEEKYAYQLMLFEQEGATQLVTVVYKRDVPFANQIKERIINSIELEVTKKQEPQNAQ